jgi:uncharacterized membrane protein YjgN (DUF898 family)
MNLNKLTQMDNQNHDYNAGNGVSLLVGFLLAFTNSIVNFLQSSMDAWLQAAILGVIGSTVTYFTNRFWRYLEKKKNKEKEI